MPRVNPDILRWARETAGLGHTDAAQKLRLSATRKLSPEERVLALEAGEAEPTVAQLAVMAEVYRRPLLTFYLREPPAPDERGEDFRTLPDREPATEGLVDALLRDVRARQAAVRDLLLDDGVGDSPLVRSFERGIGVREASRLLMERLSFDRAAFRRRPATLAAFEYLRSLAEAKGVFVVLIGDLGNYRTDLDVEAFRGFAIADASAPFVIVNDNDAKSAWSFTLLHELVHVCLGLTGVSGARSEAVVERFCNEVASQMLLPSEELEAIPFDTGAPLEAMARNVSNIARPRKLSRAMVALRLFAAGRISEVRWRDLQREFRRQWQQKKTDDRAAREDQEGGPNYYVVRRQRLGPALIALVRRHVAEGALTPAKAGQVLGVRARNVGPLLQSRTA